MKKDYNNIPFKNAAIDRMTSRTTSPPYNQYMEDRKSNKLLQEDGNLSRRNVYTKDVKGTDYKNPLFREISDISVTSKPMWNNDEEGVGSGGTDRSRKQKGTNKYVNETYRLKYLDPKATKVEAKTKGPLAYDIRSKLPKETAAAPTKKKSTGLEYEPKVRKRHMKP